MLKNITIILAGVSLLFSCKEEVSELKLPTQTYVNYSTEFTVTTSIIPEHWTEIDFSSGEIIEQMVYADTANFLHQQIYPCASCFLRPEAATALLKAKDIAQQKGLKLVVFDCYRPKRFQQQMFDIVQNPNYVAQPGKGSMHNKGLAVDIAFALKDGSLPDFGSAFDDFSELAHYNFEGLNSAVKANRKLLRSIMEQAGFSAYDKEWWHFNFTKAKYQADDFIWNCPQ